MKYLYKLFAFSFVGAAALTIVSCSNDSEPTNFSTVGVDFKPQNISADLVGGPTAAGENLYYGAVGQITEGYFAQLSNKIYAQFPINFAEQTWMPGSPWQYTFYNGGMVLSNWHDMTMQGYENQLSVYSEKDIKFDKENMFIVTNGSSQVTDPSNATLADYAGCGHVYITDNNGYKPASLDQKSEVTGNAYSLKFKSVDIANTTYTYLTMMYGDLIASPLNSYNKGWFKAQFIAFASNAPTAKPAGYVEAYLANYDASRENEAGFTGKMVTDWTKVDLTSLPEACILVVNFVGSDTGQYGLNTPAYCALDNFIFQLSN